jgi:hypothetical protein
MRRLIVLMALSVVLVACGGSSVPLAQQIIGTWKDEGTGTTQTYTADGYRTALKGFAPSCWSISGDQLHLVSPTADSDITYKVAIDGDTLKITAPLATRTHTRVDSDATLSAEEEESIAKIKGKCPAPTP